MADLDTGASTQPDELLGQAVDRAYAAFARNEIGPSMLVRRADVTETDVSTLAGPVRLVTASAIDRWLPHAVTTWGTAEDLRALLPRVLELLSLGLLETPPEAVFARLRQADAAGWPQDEQAALDEVVVAMWLAVLARHPSPMGPASSLLMALAELGHDISPFLDDWLLLLLAPTATSGDPARQHLRDLVQRVDALRASGLGVSDLFWSSHPAEAAELELWLSSPLTQEPPGG